MEKSYLIKCGKLYDGIHDQLSENMEILVIDKLIEEVGKNLSFPEGTEVIDLSQMTVTPGMIDAHVHLSYVDPFDKSVDVVVNSDGFRTLAALHSAQKILAGGFTTVRHVGWFAEDYILDVKRMINAGLHTGARIVAAPHLLGTNGSHGDGSQAICTNPHLSDILLRQYPTIGCGPDFFADAVRRERKIGADLIKIMVTGGVMSRTDQPTDIQLNDKELEAIFTTAKSLDIPVTAHAYGAAAVKKLVGFGIDCIEHGTMMDEEAARMMEDTGTFVVPTFAPGEDAIMNGEKAVGDVNPAFIKFVERAEMLKRGRQIILDSNMKIGYGTDFVPGLRHYNWECGKEFWCLKTHGMDVFRILKAATKTNAEICGLSDRIGTLEKGKYADISGWNSDLMTDPYALCDCGFVMKEGVQYQAESHIETCCRFEDL